MGLKELIELSRHYGKNEDYVIAGGGNTSYKDDYALYVKPSGTMLADLTETAMVRMRRERLDAIWTKEYARDPAKREEQALADLMAAREEGETRRPSVETLLHELIRHQYVVHTHPALVNGLTCGKRGRKIAQDLFPNRMVWVPVVNPGYVLASTVKKTLEEHIDRGGAYPNVIFLQNHGIFVSADSIEEVRAVYDRVMTNLSARIDRRPDLAPGTPADAARAEALRQAIAKRFGGELELVCNREIARLVATRRSFTLLRTLSYTPDHIVYCGHESLWLDWRDDEESMIASFETEEAAYRERNGHPPRIIAAQRIGIYARGESAGPTESARAMFLDALKVAVYAESFGGAVPMPPEKRDFIRSWEVERYRAQLNSQAGT